MSAFFCAENLKIRYEPFPIGQMAPVVEDGVYEELLDDWPDLELFEYKAHQGHKWTLAETCNGANYRKFVKETPVWTRFDRWIKSPDFIDAIMGSLLERHIDLGYRPGISRTRQMVKNLKAMVRGRPANRGIRLAASWEFQMISADGGHLLPHTDAPSKIVTMTLSMVRKGEWDISTGGGIDINRPIHESLAFNQLNDQARFEDMETIDTLEFLPNSGVVFIKTFNSWHSVRPIQGPKDGLMRRNIIVNVMAR